MTTPHVTEKSYALEAVTHDPFIDGLDAASQLSSVFVTPIAGRGPGPFGENAPDARDRASEIAH
jgi:hypothetical protein